MPEYILEMKDINKSFPGVHVLKDVLLQLKKGEVHALMGENGAGKSTLMKILMGIYKSDSGAIYLDDQPVHFSNPKEAMHHGISMIHQELNPVLDMQVYENVFIGREVKTKIGLVDKKKMAQETKRIFEEIGIDIDPLTEMRTLSVAQAQLVEIVKAISMQAKIIIMDEPTSAITETEVETLFEQIKKLKAENVSILYISHKMDEIFTICDRITVLRDGEYIATKPVKEVTEEQLIKLMVGRDITDVFPKFDVPITDEILKVENWNWNNYVKNISFSLHKGEILGFAGLVGAGRSELVESIFGIRKNSKGQIYLNGEALQIKKPLNAIKKKIALITEDRKFTGLNLEGSVAENITLVALSQLFPRGLISKKIEKREAEKYIETLKIKTQGKDQLVLNLSGGNQQKVVLAKWLLTEPDIIILDEPTRGIDVGAKRDIYLLVGELVKAGKAVILISSEIAELMGISDRIIVMAEGRFTGELKREEFSQERIMTYASDFGGKNE